MRTFIVYLCACCLWIACHRLTVAAEPVSAEALRIHHSGLLFDGHNDLPWQVGLQAGGDWSKLDIAQLQPTLHTDLPKLKHSGLKAQFWSVYVPVETIDAGNAALRTLEQVELVRQMVQRYPDHFEIANTAADVERIAASGKIASLMGVEGGHSLEGSVSLLKRYHELGVRYVTLTHSRSLEWATSSTDEANGRGLSEFGREMVREMNRLGMLVDLSHVSTHTMRDTLDVSQAPILFSHSSVRSICEHHRNVPDDIIRRLPENGGVLLINFMSGYVVPTEELRRDPLARGTVATVVDHIEHVIRVAGIDHVGLGSDFDGVSRLPVGLEDVTGYPRITQELLNRGYSADQIHQVLGGNVLRVLQRAEAVAAESTRP